MVFNPVTVTAGALLWRGGDKIELTLVGVRLDMAAERLVFERDMNRPASDAVGFDCRLVVKEFPGVRLSQRFRWAGNFDHLISLW